MLRSTRTLASDIRLLRSNGRQGLPFETLSRQRALSGAKQTSNEWMASKKKPVAEDRLFLFGSGGAICTVPTMLKRVRLK
jgi:hypothetical protein